MAENNSAHRPGHQDLAVKATFLSTLPCSERCEVLSAAEISSKVSRGSTRETETNLRDTIHDLEGRRPPCVTSV